MRKTLVTILACIITLTAFAEGRNAKKDILFERGKGSVPYECQAPFEGRTINIFYYIPEGDIDKMPVQIIMHGMGRNGDGYRDVWIKEADKYGFIVITPTFDDAQFCEAEYQQGNVRANDGKFNRKSKLTYVLIDRIFDFFISHSESNAEKFNIYGHSAGAQFVHRYLQFYNPKKVAKAVAANSGWYTFPTEGMDYPYGQGDAAGILRLSNANYYAKDFTVILGTADTLRTSSLRQTPEADLQGLNRLERGKNFYKYCKNDAERLGVKFNWKLEFVEGSNHSNAKMAPLAAEIIYGR